MTLTEFYQSQISDGTLTEDSAQTSAVAQLQRISTALGQPEKRGWFSRKSPPPKGLYLWGGVGRGKSMIMDMFARCTPMVRRVHFHAFMQDVHAGMKAARADGVEDALLPVADHVASGIRGLAFDEMQITDITDAMIVGRLFEQLMERGVVIVATSNRHPDDLYKNGLNRALFLPFIDVLKDRLVIHELASPTDYRQDRLAGSPVYFTPISAGSSAALDKLWADLTGGSGEPLELSVKGRTVVIPEFRNGVGRIGFADICGKPLGPADYLAVADALKVLMLDDIPELGPQNANEAKRFVTLIDALYEAQVKLIATAAADPEQLYPKGTGSFEFARTASRLREMQSQDWAA